MIDSISVPLEEFDFVRFFAAIEEFCCCCAPDEERDHRFIHALKQHGDIPLPPPEGQNVIKALLKGELMLFFPMHQPLVATGALAVDGRRRPFRSFGIRCRDAYGWLVEVHDGMVSLHPALLDGTSERLPRLDLQARCGPLDECMDRFIRQFVLVKK